MSPQPSVLFFHVLDETKQFAGVEKVILKLAQGIAQQGFRTAIAVNDGVLAETARKTGVEVFPITAAKNNFLSFFFQWRAIVQKFQPDLVHSNHRYTTLLAQILPGRRYRLIHTVQNEYRDKTLLRFFGDTTAAASRALKNDFLGRFSWPPEKVTVIYDALDLPAYDPRAVRRGSEDHLTAVVVARLEEQKGHEYLVSAVKYIPEPLKARLKIIFVGDGKKKDFLVQLAEKEKASIIQFAGFQENVAPYFLKADFSILPSVWEGLGMSILESFSLGKPVIATRVGGIPELVRDHENGLLVPAQDPQALARAITEFLEHPERLPGYGEAGRKVTAQFTPQRMVQEYRDLYVKEGRLR
jgi:glycosyltransferase involved in cell wall biosynthesis